MEFQMFQSAGMVSSTFYQAAATPAAGPVLEGAAALAASAMARVII